MRGLSAFRTELLSPQFSTFHEISPGMKRTGWTESSEPCVWLEQGFFLGTRADMDDIARAFEKVHENRDALNRWVKKGTAK